MRTVLAGTAAKITARLRIIDPGPSTTIQDLGRPGLAHLGVTRSGAADRTSLRLANRLAGNPEGAPALENTYGGLSFTVSQDRYVAITGAAVDVRVDGRIVDEPTRIRLAAGRALTLGRPRFGLRTYVAVAGGLAVSRVFGSAATDFLSGLGPGPVTAGDTLALGEVADPPELPVELAVSRLPSATIDLAFRCGPRDTLFPARDRATLVNSLWTISPHCNRVGARLIGPRFTVGSLGLPSEGMAPGAIQVPPAGEPIVFLADHPVTGGYPVVGVVTDRDIDLLAQAPPGTAVRFRPLPRGGR